MLLSRQSSLFSSSFCTESLAASGHLASPFIAGLSDVMHLLTRPGASRGLHGIS